MSAIEWEPLGAEFGALAAIDFTRPLPSDFTAAWKELYEARHLIVVRGANVDADRQRELAELVGVLCPNESADGSRSMVAHISSDEGKGSLGTTELAFHSDYSFTPCPLDGICLFGLKLADGMSSTKWVSGASAYAALAAQIRARVDQAEVLNVISNVRCARNRFNIAPPTIPATRQPMVQADAAGRKYLYCNEAQTDHIVGLSPDESDAILDCVYAVLYDPARVVEHVWSQGDLVIWNNRHLQHARGDISGAGERTLRRFQLGRKSLHSQFPNCEAMIRDSYGRGLLPDDAAVSS